MTAGPVRAVLDGVEQGLDPDDVLRAAVAALVEEPGVAWAGIAFVEEDQLRLGPAGGVPDEERRMRTPIVYEGSRVAEIWLDGEIDAGDLDRIAAVVAPYALIGWDTGGEAWDP